MQRLRAVVVIAVPSGEGSAQRPGAPQLDGPGPRGASPRDLAQMPAGERDRIVDHDDEILLAARILLADLGVAPLDEQPAAAARPRQRG